jgi:hypothetical protein
MMAFNKKKMKGKREWIPGRRDGRKRKADKASFGRQIGRVWRQYWIEWIWNLDDWIRENVRHKNVFAQLEIIKIGIGGNWGWGRRTNLREGIFGGFWGNRKGGESATVHFVQI